VLIQNYQAYHRHLNKKYNNIVILLYMKLHKKYLIEDTILGVGTYSVVHAGINKFDNSTVAIKKITKTKNNIINELNILRKIDDLNICNMIDYFEGDNDHFIILELCNTNLHEYIKHHGYLQETKAQYYFKQLSHGLEYLQDSNIIHRDIKPENLLIDEFDTLKISDFGFAVKFEENETFEILCGSPLYMAPEIMKSKQYNNKIDLWSSGIVLFQMLFNKTPYTAKNHYELLQKIESKHVSIPNNFCISENCKNILQHLLVKNPIKRINWKKFYKHPFIYDQPKSIPHIIHKSNPISIPSSNKKMNVSFSPSDNNSIKIIDTPAHSLTNESFINSFNESLITRMKNPDMFRISYDYSGL